MKIPPVRHPTRYAGLYVYDFGDRVSVGFTGNEVRMLRQTPAYRAGTAFEIYRVNEHGGFELRGATEDRLGTLEALCFLRDHGADARRDYDTLVALAERAPVGANVEVVLAKVYDFAPPDVTGMIYAVAASQVVSSWLIAHAPDLSAAVDGGPDTHDKFTRSSGMRIASRQLTALMDYTDRSLEAVKAHAGRAVQR